MKDVLFFIEQFIKNVKVIKHVYIQFYTLHHS